MVLLLDRRGFLDSGCGCGERGDGGSAAAAAEEEEEELLGRTRWSCMVGGGHSLSAAAADSCDPSMHPPLMRPHPDCQEYIQKLIACHEEHPWAKFFGTCNEVKRDLDQCFRVEKERMRKENARIARERRAKFLDALEKEGQSINT
jgi:COX assembly protein 2